MYHKNKMSSIIRSTGTTFYSLLYRNLLLGFYGLKYVYLVIPVIEIHYQAMLKSRESLPSWTARVRLVNSLADPHSSLMLVNSWTMVHDGVELCKKDRSTHALSHGKSTGRFALVCTCGALIAPVFPSG